MKELTLTRLLHDWHCNKESGKQPTYVAAYRGDCTCTVVPWAATHVASYASWQSVCPTCLPALTGRGGACTSGPCLMLVSKGAVPVVLLLLSCLFSLLSSVRRANHPPAASCSICRAVLSCEAAAPC